MTEKADTSLKRVYNQELVADMAKTIAQNAPSFNAQAFIHDVMQLLPTLELKGRAWCITEGLHKHLPSDYPTALAVLLQSMRGDHSSGGMEGMGGFRYLPFLNFVEKYGLETPELSLQALERMTRFFSAEFAIRPYLIQHRDRTLAAAYAWARNEDWHLRRLASEGARPRLPWGLRLKEFVADPTPIFPILRALFNDPHPIVRRSVANNLNDISKDHPALAVAFAAQELEIVDRPETRQLVNHALRNLRKRGDKATSDLLGLAHNISLKLNEFTLQKSTIAMGEEIKFSLCLTNEEEESQRVVIQYAIHHLRKNGSTTAKIFKIAERVMLKGESLRLNHRHSFRAITTRKYYPGQHKIEIFAGGLALGEQSFELTLPLWQ